MATTIHQNDTEIQGKQSVSLGQHVGGDLHVEGKGVIDHDLEVEGTLRAGEIHGLDKLLRKVLRDLSAEGDGLATAAELQLLMNELRELLEKSDTRYLSREDKDRAKGLIRFLDGIQLGETFISGPNGKGGRITGGGDGELQSLILHKFLEVPELRYNRVSIEVGNSWRAPGGGIVERCIPDRDEDGNLLMTGTVYLHLEDGEIGTIAEDDICMGIFHNETQTQRNDAVTLDDGIGNFRFAGFQSVYFRITEILNQGNNSSFRYALRPVSDTWMHTCHPTEAMHFVGYGNFSDKNRQTARYSTRTYERYLKDVNSWEFGAVNIAAQFGDLSNLSVFGMDMAGYSAYLNNIYMVGTIEQMNALFPRMEIDLQGDNFLAYGETKTVTCRVFRGWEDITEQVTNWSVTRDTGDPLEDEVWNLKPKAQLFDGTIILSFSAEENDLGTNPMVISTVFTFKADIDDEVSAEQTLSI